MEEQLNEQLLVNAISLGDIDGARARVGICDINAKVNGKPILHHAADRSVEMLTLILDQPGVNIDAVDTAGFSALHISADEKDSIKLSLLLARGAQADLLSYDGISTLMIAAQNGCADNVRLLLAQDVNVTRKNRIGKGCVALGYAIVRVLGNSKDLDGIAILKLLLAHGAAFCLDEPRLKTVIPFMDHFSGCYFFDTKMGREKITSKTEGFELATVFEFGSPEKKINFTEIPIPILLSRCDEILSENKKLPRLKELRRCLLFNLTEEKQDVTGQVFRGYVLDLRKLCLEQIARQPNVRLEDVVVDSRDSVRKFKELELSDKRIAELSKLIFRSDVRGCLKRWLPVGTGVGVFVLALALGLFYAIRPLKHKTLLTFVVFGILFCAAILGFASAFLMNQINFHELTKLKAFLQRVENEDADGCGLNAVIEVEGTTDSIKYFEQYHSKLTEYRQELSSNVMRTVKHHHFFQRVFESEEKPVKNRDVVIEIVEDDIELSQKNPVYQSLPANDNNAGSTYSLTQNPPDVNAHRATK